MYVCVAVYVCFLNIRVCISFCLFFDYLYVLTVQCVYFSPPFFNLFNVSRPIISSWLSFHEANADQCGSFIPHIANDWCWIFFFLLFLYQIECSQKKFRPLYLRNNFSLFVFSFLKRKSFVKKVIAVIFNVLNIFRNNKLTVNPINWVVFYYSRCVFLSK